MHAGAHTRRDGAPTCTHPCTRAHSEGRAPCLRSLRRVLLEPSPCVESPYTGTPLSVLSGMGGEQVLLSGKGVFSVKPDNAPFRTLELVLLPGNVAFL